MSIKCYHTNGLIEGQIDPLIGSAYDMGHRDAADIIQITITINHTSILYEA